MTKCELCGENWVIAVWEDTCDDCLEMFASGFNGLTRG